MIWLVQGRCCCSAFLTGQLSPSSHRGFLHSRICRGQNISINTFPPTYICCILWLTTFNWTATILRFTVCGNCAVKTNIHSSLSVTCNTTGTIITYSAKYLHTWWTDIKWMYWWGVLWKSFQAALTLPLLDPAGIPLDMARKGTNELIVCIYQWLEGLLKASASLQFKFKTLVVHRWWRR